MKKHALQRGWRAAALILTGMVISGANAQEIAYPTKPVSFVTGVGAGSNNDIVLRMLAEDLRKRWGQAVTVENKPGAVGAIGSAFVARAAPDGYTLLLTSTGGQIHNALLKKGLAYDPVGDFDPISLVAEGTYCFVVDAASPYKTVQDFLDATQNTREGLTFGSWGPGSATHLLGETLAQHAKGEMLHVPYTGEMGALTDLNGGRLDASWLGSGSAQTMAEAGRVRVLATTGSERSAQLPDVPTFNELGLDDLQVTGWIGIYAP